MNDPNNANRPDFELDNVGYIYNGKITALDHINMEILPGECFAILGSNGSGKSTLLKILDGLYFPTSGCVTAFGQPLTEDSFRNDRFNFEFRSRVGFVFQDSDVQLFMPSVWEEIAFAPLQMGLSQAEVAERVEAALSALRIEKLKERPPHQLSGGEKKRVALASVLSLTPQVWLLDEPSAGLDPRSVSWLVEFIHSQRSVRKTVVLATHDISLVEAVAERVSVIDEEHHLVACGSPQEILADTELLVNSNLIR